MCKFRFFSFVSIFLTGYIVNQLAECFTLYKYYKMKMKLNEIGNKAVISPSSLMNASKMINTAD